MPSWVACLEACDFRGNHATVPCIGGCAGEQTDTFRGTKTTFDFTHEDTAGSPKAPGHYSASEIPGISPPLGLGRPDPGRLSAVVRADGALQLIGLHGAALSPRSASLCK